MKHLNAENKKRTGEKLKRLRETLMLSQQQLATVLLLSRSTITRIESGDGVSPGIDNYGMLIFFFGYTFETFFTNSFKYPNEHALRQQIEEFHRKEGSETYKVIYSQPDFSELVNNKVLKSNFFETFRDVQTTLKHIEDKYGFRYPSSVASNYLKTLSNRKTLQFRLKEGSQKDHEYKKAN